MCGVPRKDGDPDRGERGASALDDGGDTTIGAYHDDADDLDGHHRLSSQALRRLKPIRQAGSRVLASLWAAITRMHTRFPFFSAAGCMHFCGFLGYC